MQGLSQVRFVLFLLLLLGILSAATPHASVVVTNAQIPALPEHELHSGDLIFRRASGPASEFVDTLDEKGNFSHVGLVYVETDGSIYVLHVAPAGPGITQAEPLGEFLAQSVAVTAYRPNPEIATAADTAVSTALGWVNTKPFDRAFSLTTDESLYCTELIYKAYLAAGIDILQGRFDPVDLPFLEAKRVIYPSSLIESGLFTLLFTSP